MTPDACNRQTHHFNAGGGGDNQEPNPVISFVDETTTESSAACRRPSASLPFDALLPHSRSSRHELCFAGNNSTVDCVSWIFDRDITVHIPSLKSTDNTDDY
ncbi:unnamed protein product [Lactuca saligna]|uniref:Uncharacterized protein n=1 Tax=Lactuca saligna TaxID=75948 RepID=A0AA35ZXF0_LACSI|nr:unnamed protein product [Lactuca saligna]